MLFSRFKGAVCASLLASQTANAISLDTSDTASIKQAADTIAHGMMNYYTGNLTGGTPGELPSPYYWWEAGGMWGSLIDYWYYTGDTTYNEVTSQGLLFQIGPNNDYMPPNQTKDEGNDDQGFWGMAAMSAAEANFPNPPDTYPGWLALAQAVFNKQAQRWDDSTCGGGLRWQIYQFNNGYDYKNSISNGCFFNIAARLYAYTGNSTYSDWAEKTFDWVAAVGLMGSGYEFYDGTDDSLNCTEVNHIQWTYNAGVFLYGAAMMYNHTESDVWKNRTQSIWDACNVFFTGASKQVMYEVACETTKVCDTDQLSFKAYFSRWLAATTKVAPFLEPQIMPFLYSSAAAAAAQCNGGSDGVTCGTEWTVSTWDGTYGVGQQMSAMQVIQSLLISEVAGPLTNDTGGTSVGDSNAGSGSDSSPTVPATPITTADRAGAGIITALVLIGLLGGAWWMVA